MGTTDDCRGWLFLPEDGSTVGPIVPVMGRAVGLPPEHELWIVHRRIAGGVIWPKEPRVQPNASGNFTMSAFEGGAPGKIIVSLLMVPSSLGIEFNRWMENGHRTGNYLGIPNSSAMVELASVSVSFNPSTKSRGPLKVFLAHSSSDKEQVRHLYRRLIDAGFEPWLDEESLVPGETWKEAITKAIRDSDAIMICLSENAVNRVGYIHKEIKEALDVAELQPEGSIFIIPVKLGNFEMPTRLADWQWVHLGEDRGWQKLVGALRRRANSVGAAYSKHFQSPFS